MDPLITIETVPIKIEYVQKEQSSHSSTTQSAQLNISRNDNVMTIQSNPISIPVADTFEPSSSNDWSSLTYTATAQYSSYGNLRMNVQMQNTSDNAYQYQQFGRGIDNMVDSLPKTSNSSYDNMQIDFDMSGFFGNSSGSESVDTSFMPPDLELKVVEQPKVIVKYVGGPIYVPRSADPNYDASKAIGPTYFPESADPDFDSSDAAAATLLYFPESADPNFEKEMALIDGKSKLDLRA